jgi:hypothetical protein
LVGFQMKAKSTLNQVLFFKFSKSSKTVKYAAGKATIYEVALATQRATIAARLADYRSVYIGQVRFTPPPGASARGMGRGIRRTDCRMKVAKFSPGKYLRG